MGQPWSDQHRANFKATIAAKRARGEGRRKGGKAQVVELPLDAIPARMPASLRPRKSKVEVEQPKPLMQVDLSETQGFITINGVRIFLGK